MPGNSHLQPLTLAPLSDSARACGHSNLQDIGIQQQTSCINMPDSGSAPLLQKCLSKGQKHSVASAGIF